MEKFSSEDLQTSPLGLTLIIAVIVCDCFNIGLLLYGMRQMYFGIEISHPVYATLFCNLASVLTASAVEIVALPFLKDIRAETFVKSCASFYAIFHGTTWLVMSVLRYLYIVHSNWVHAKFPNSRSLTVISIGFIYLIYSICLATTLSVLVPNGWPYIEVNEMDPGPRMACVAAVFANYGCILGLSSIFYFLILHQRGAVGKNSVQVQPDKAEDVKQVVVSDFSEVEKKPFLIRAKKFVLLW